MSHEVEETYSVYNERLVRARKPNKCCACDEPILPGHQYTRVFIVFRGDIERVDRCARCQAIHEHLRTVSAGETWPAERLDCGEEYRDHWGLEPPPEIAALAFALPSDFARKADQ